MVLSNLMTAGKKGLFISLCMLSLAGCTQFWVKEGENIQQISKSLEECRLKGSQAVNGVPIFNAQQIEGPCMTAKGYTLSYSPAKE